MRRLTLKDVWLISKLDEKARHVVLDPNVTVIKGGNQTGKSSLIKSIYHTMGADALFSTKWKSSNIIGCVGFAIDEKSYYVLRNGKYFGLFNSNFQLIKASKGITAGIGPVLATLFDFKLKLTDSSSKRKVVPTPAFHYLPFYVDQDKSWKTPWNAFDGLGQFSNFKKDVMEYFVGIKPPEYYEYSDEIAQLAEFIAASEKERAVIQNARDRLVKEKDVILVNINIDEYKADIDALLRELNMLKTRQEEYRLAVSALASEKVSLEIQKDIAVKALNEIEKDREYLNAHLEEDHIECPTCGEVYDNSMVNRFSLSDDAEQCRAAISAVTEKLGKAEDEIAGKQQLLDVARQQAEQIEAILVEKRGQVVLRDYIQSESNRQINRNFSETLESLSGDIKAWEGERTEKSKLQAALTNKARTKEINEFFLDKMALCLSKLNVQTVDLSRLRTIPLKIGATGSETPRALTAYFFSLLYTIEQFSSSVIMPFIVDSPNQDDQDPNNERKIMNFCIQQRPKKAQYILGTVGLHGAKYDGYEINLNEKFGLLREDEYDEVNELLASKIDAVLDAV